MATYKPYRNTQVELSWADEQRIREEILAEIAPDFKVLNWTERMALPDLERLEYDQRRNELDITTRELFQERATEILTKDRDSLTIRNNSLDSFCSVFQRADRILTGLANVSVSVTEERTEIPAWSDGKSVTFNVSAMKELDNDSLLSLHGLNYHEVAHLLYTPRVGSALGTWVSNQIKEGNNSIQYAFNLLEDFRAENYLITKYPSVAEFLQAVVVDYALDRNNATNEDYEVLFVLLAGRPFMPHDLIATAGQLYAKIHGVDKAKLLYESANEYRKLVFPRDYARAQELITQIATLLPSDKSMFPNGCGSRDVLRNGRPTGEKEQSAIAGQQAGEPDLDELFQKFDNMMSGKAEDNEGDSDNKPSESSSGATKGKTAEGIGNGESIAELLGEKLEKAFADLKNSETVERKLHDTKKAIAKTNSAKTYLTKQTRTMENPKLSDVMAVRMFAEELERIRIECDPDWQREVPTGKLNVRRAINADVNDINKLFDRWTTGNDDYDMEACILLDRSGSMYHMMNQASKATWVIKRAIEKIEGKVSVITFNDESRLLYSADEKATTQYPEVTSSGSTDPYMGLLEAERILTNSNKKTKLLFLVTDGQFYGGKSDPIIQNLNNAGVNTNVVFLSGHDNWAKWGLEHAEELAHGAQNFRVVTKPADLVKVAKDVVRHQIQSVMR